MLKNLIPDTKKIYSGVVPADLIITNFHDSGKTPATQNTKKTNDSEMSKLEIANEIAYNNNQNYNKGVKNMSKDYSEMTPQEFAGEMAKIKADDDKVRAREKIDEIENSMSNEKYLNPVEFAKWAKNQLASKKSNLMNIEKAQNLVREFHNIPVKKISIENQNYIDNSDEKKMTGKEAKDLIRQYSR